MNDRIKAARIEGDVTLSEQNIYADGANLVELRKRIGMVFQHPNPFPKSIRENVAYGPRKHGDIDRGLVPGYSDATTRTEKTSWSSGAFATPPSGTRSKTALTTTRWDSPAASNSGCASPDVSPLIPKSF